jgi:hypothetical protein
MAYKGPFSREALLQMAAERTPDGVAAGEIVSVLSRAEALARSAESEVIRDAAERNVRLITATARDHMKHVVENQFDARTSGFYAHLKEFSGYLDSRDPRYKSLLQSEDAKPKL